MVLTSAKHSRGTCSWTNRTLTFSMWLPLKFILYRDFHLLHLSSVFLASNPMLISSFFHYRFILHHIVRFTSQFCLCFPFFSHELPLPLFLQEFKRLYFRRYYCFNCNKLRIVCYIRTISCYNHLKVTSSLIELNYLAARIWWILYVNVLKVLFHFICFAIKHLIIDDGNFTVFHFIFMDVKVPP